jgi:hypothetical protein
MEVVDELEGDRVELFRPVECDDRDVGVRAVDTNIAHRSSSIKITTLL